MKKFAVYDIDSNNFMFFIFADFWSLYNDYLVFYRNNEVYTCIPNAYSVEVDNYG